MSATHPTKAAAQAWATQIEADIIAGKTGGIPNKTFGDLLQRFQNEVSTGRKGEQWERVRIGMLMRDPLADVRLGDLDERSIAEWRDRRLKSVSAASVRREWNLLSAACTIAVKEWKWLKSHPMRNVRRPPSSPPRDRIFSDDEIERMVLCFGDDLKSISGRVGAAFLFAIETGMRCGEICNLTWERIDLTRRVARVAVGKTLAASREVPLSGAAIEILNKLRAAGTPGVFGLNTTQIDAIFRKVRANALVDGVHFHDTRATAITRLAKKLDILALARMVGHKDLKMLQVYYRESAEEIAKRL
jgi:integrase